MNCDTILEDYYNPLPDWDDDEGWAELKEEHDGEEDQEEKEDDTE